MEEKKALKNYNRKAEEIGAENETTKKYLLQLKQDIVDEYTLAKEKNAEKAVLLHAY